MTNKKKVNNMEEINKLSKKELEELGRTYDVELDRRKKKDVLIQELREVIGDSIVEESTEELREVQPSLSTNNVIKEEKPQSFRSLREAKIYAKENGGRVVEKGRFYVL